MLRRSLHDSAPPRRLKRKLDPTLAGEIRNDWKVAPGTARDAIAKKYGVSISTVEAVLKNKIWKKVA